MMPESESLPRAPARAGRAWVYAAAAGVALVVLALTIVLLVIVDKTHFGWMVGSAFLGSVTALIMGGAILLLVATWKLPVRRSWRGAVLFAWGLIALASPAFGILFLLPWTVLAVALPVVAAIVFGQFRTRAM